MKHCFRWNSGSELKTVVPKPKRVARNCQQSTVRRAQRPRGIVWIGKVKNIWWHFVLMDTPKTNKQFCIESFSSLETGEVF